MTNTNTDKTQEMTTKYTSKECLTPSQLAKKFGVPTERVRQIMKIMKMNNAGCNMHGHFVPAIIKTGKSSTERLHPTGFDIFEQYLQR